MTSAIASQEEAHDARSPDSFELACCRRSLLSGACASYVEVPVETPLQSKIDVAEFRRVLVAGFVTDLGDSDVDVSARRRRACSRTSCAASTKLQVLEPDRPPLHDALEKALEKLGEGGKYTKEEKDQYSWRRTASCRTPSTGGRSARSTSTRSSSPAASGFEEQNRSGFQSDERVVRDPGTNRPRLRARQPLPGAQGLQPFGGVPLRRRPDRADACTRRSSRRRCSTAKSRRSRPSRPTSSSWTACSPTSWASSRPRRSGARASSFIGTAPCADARRRPGRSSPSSSLCPARRGRCPPRAQFFPYYGKNKVTYDNFAWRVYKTPALRDLLLPRVRAAPGARRRPTRRAPTRRSRPTLKHEIG